MLEKNTPNAEMLYDLADLFKVFGDTTRIRILYALFESEMCVCAIAEF
ncbi:MAG: ArsR family transcriptional regulator, partial [Clostridia bacterium]|nr:ArsR family transcriptional regulator [Clostridia bacterium]